MLRRREPAGAADCVHVPLGILRRGGNHSGGVSRALAQQVPRLELWRPHTRWAVATLHTSLRNALWVVPGFNVPTLPTLSEENVLEPYISPSIVARAKARAGLSASGKIALSKMAIADMKQDLLLVDNDAFPTARWKAQKLNRAEAALGEQYDSRLFLSRAPQYLNSATQPGPCAHTHIRTTTTATTTPPRPPLHATTTFQCRPRASIRRACSSCCDRSWPPATRRLWWRRTCRRRSC